MAAQWCSLLCNGLHTILHNSVLSKRQSRPAPGSSHRTVFICPCHLAKSLATAGWIQVRRDPPHRSANVTATVIEARVVKAQALLREIGVRFSLEMCSLTASHVSQDGLGLLCDIGHVILAHAVNAFPIPGRFSWSCACFGHSICTCSSPIQIFPGRRP